jgi:hypothetical protein
MTTTFDLTKNATRARRSRAHGVAFPQGNATAFRIPPPEFPPLCGGSPNEIWDAPEAHEPMYNEIANCRCKVRYFFNPKL